MVEFKLFGIPVRIESSFWLTFLILGFLIIRPQSSSEYLIVALFILAAFLSILICELGHAVVVRKNSLPAAIVFSTFGGYVLYPFEALSRKQSFAVAAAGPILQVVIALSVDLGISFLHLPDTMLNHFLGIFIYISYFWAFYSCLPMYPLNGGRMLAAVLGPNRESTLYFISLVVAFLAAVIAVKVGYIFIAIFMAMYVYQNYQHWQRTK